MIHRTPQSEPEVESPSQEAFDSIQPPPPKPRPRWRFDRFLFSRAMGAVFFACLIFVFAHPSHGFQWPGSAGESVETCGMVLQFGVPCPGCGMTRGVSCVVKGHWWSAFQYNIFAFPVALLLIIGSSLLFLPATARGRFEAYINERPNFWLYLYIGVIVLFFLYGALRIALIWLWPETRWIITHKFQ